MGIVSTHGIRCSPSGPTTRSVSLRHADDDDTKAPPLGENVDTAPLSIPSVRQQQQSTPATPTPNTAAIGMAPPAVASSVHDDSTRAPSAVAPAVISQPALQNAPHVVTDRNKPRDAASSLVSTNTISSPAASVATAPLSETNLALLSSGGGGATLPPPLPSIASTTITVTRTTSSAARHEIGATNALFRESESSGEEEEEEEDDELEDDDDDTATVQHQVASRIAAAAAATRRPPSPTLTEQYGFFDRRPTSPGVVRSTFDPFGTARTQQQPVASNNSATSSLLRTTATTVVSDDLVVYTTATGNCYHNERCRYRPFQYVSEADAQRSGLRACMQCGGRPFRRPSQ
ncbi:Hypothetical protein, putative [Bodo saltans]|uniref:Ada DNA repair metal-binding domain-containing protein n=1 Tax=Bodo saltans TaxID=75058 RepID=A0A0S4J231_BODSA|nr:Hypothetical protein, putative [Bodo saltans]|eukprot:CUG83393.1 Hypothetical protein, putative [Bodo saltans]